MQEDKPKIIYGSRHYKFLCYAKMRGDKFSLSEARECLSGVFHQPNLYGIKTVAKVLVDKSLVEYHKETDLWSITYNGMKEIINSASYYRVAVHRQMGPRFMTIIRQELSKSVEIGPYMSEEQMDAEDAVLEKINQKMRERTLKKGSYRKKPTETP
jgi:hypothetical protein